MRRRRAVRWRKRGCAARIAVRRMYLGKQYFKSVYHCNSQQLTAKIVYPWRRAGIVRSCDAISQNYVSWLVVHIISSDILFNASFGAVSRQGLQRRHRTQTKSVTRATTRAAPADGYLIPSYLPATIWRYGCRDRPAATTEPRGGTARNGVLPVPAVCRTRETFF